MKKIEIVIKADRLEEIKEILLKCDAKGLMITNIMGFGNQKGYTKSYRGTKFVANLLPKLKIETVVDDKSVEELIDEVHKQIATGDYGHGKIFVYNVEEVIRIRTGERGESAL